VVKRSKSSCKTIGSIVDCHNQTLGERIPVVGTPYSLVYSSDRAQDRLPQVDIPLSGTTVPVKPGQILLRVSIAGRKFSYWYLWTSQLVHTFTWDGKDAYGRLLQGSQPLSIEIDYIYVGSYTAPAALRSSFGYDFGGNIAVEAREEVSLLQRHSIMVPPVTAPAKRQGLGGWTLDPVHTYDPIGKTLHFGNGDAHSGGLHN